MVIIIELPKRKSLFVCGEHIADSHDGFTIPLEDIASKVIKTFDLEPVKTITLEETDYCKGEDLYQVAVNRNPELLKQNARR